MWAHTTCPPYICYAIVLGLNLLLFSSTTCASPQNPREDLPDFQKSQRPVYGYRILNRYPHDPRAFTQGLVIDAGILYESTGGYGESTLREVDLTTGRLQRAVRLPQRVFGEGLTAWGERLIQLSWQSKTGFVFDKASLTLRQQFTYTTEGWGLTHNNQQLIMSDGSATLTFLDPVTFAVVRRLAVTDNGLPVKNLNELEFVKGEIWANLWYSERIARISPTTGQVTAWIDLSGITGPLRRALAEGDVLNGIAYDQQQERIYVTGKRWPQLYEIELLAPQSR